MAALFDAYWSPRSERMFVRSRLEFFLTDDTARISRRFDEVYRAGLLGRYTGPLEFLESYEKGFRKRYLSMTNSAEALTTSRFHMMETRERVEHLRWLDHLKADLSINGLEAVCQRKEP